jgi:pSer/pThr/pTyr-binding forkhead associated (FHA) protein
MADEPSRPGDLPSVAEDEFAEDVSTTESSVGILLRERDRRPACLEQTEGPGAPRVIPLDQAEMILGRGTDSHVLVPSSEVSRSHMRIRHDGTAHLIRDLDSRNGVLLNGVRVHSASLHEGDVLQLGNAVFVFHEGQA